MVLNKLINVFEKLQYINDEVIENLFCLPYAIICEMIDSIKREDKEEKKIKTEKEILIERIESGEVCMADLPHTRIEGDNVFAFHYEDYKGEKYKIGSLVYVETEYNEPIHRFFKEQKEEVDKWERKYGYKILFLDQDDFFKNMCFPQERSMLKHGLLYNGGVSTGDREYSVNIRPWGYVELDPNNAIPIQGQLSLIAQYLCKDYLGYSQLNIDFSRHTVEDC
ncbi:MAG: hypothetical protein MJZ36_00280 [Bacteroidaceae bacterium]|nr:hypothetical protein [Bacteroidaceae bacterium]